MTTVPVKILKITDDVDPESNVTPYGSDVLEISILLGLHKAVREYCCPPGVIST